MFRESIYTMKSMWSFQLQIKLTSNFKRCCVLMKWNISGAQLVGRGGRGEERGGGLPFLKIEKKCPDFGKMCPVCVRLSAMD